jgi:hypothetical protein
MPLFRRKREREADARTPTTPRRPPDELVKLYLRAQNLEQLRRVDEAVELYEEAIEHGFDAAGPYDRLIAIYLGLGELVAVRRVADAALSNVRTFGDKRAWYESVRSEAADGERARSDRRGAEF